MRNTRDWPVWLRALVALLAIGATGPAAGRATFLLGFSAVGAWVAAAVAAVLALVVPFIVGALQAKDANGEVRGDPRKALSAPFSTIPRELARRAPNQLLRAVYRQAPFRGRTTEIAGLTEWCRSSSDGA